MNSLRLRTKFLLSFLLIISALTGGTLLIVQSRLREHQRQEISSELQNSVANFEQFERERELNAVRSAELLANIPNLRAMMTTQDAATIQDASTELWRLAGSGLFVLADRGGRIVALHTNAPGLSRGDADEFIRRSLREDQPSHWWYGGGHLYEVFLQPIYFGPPANNSPLGVLAVGYEVDAPLAQEVSRIAASQVAFGYGGQIVVSTLESGKEAELARAAGQLAGQAALEPRLIQLGEERFLATSVGLTHGGQTEVSLTVLKSYDQATRYLEGLDRLLLGLGLVGVAMGSLLVFLISDTFTRPLASLVAGVRALEGGSYDYPLETQGRDEVGELARAFDRMRNSLEKAHREVLDAERLATIGRMASSISHDLRHPLTSVLANAEFLTTQNLNGPQREDLYQEIRVAVDQMTDLVESLLEFSRAREHLHPIYGRMKDTVERAAQTVRAHPEYGRVNIAITCEGRGEAWFDPKKMERVFLNLLLNACQAAPPSEGRVEVRIRDLQDGMEIEVADNGGGIPEAIRGTLFQPFISHGKENGTGLGLTVVQKIFQDHGGEVSVESTGAGHTVFRLSLPRNGLAAHTGAA
jgi:signal transduction histidine kinase